MKILVAGSEGSLMSWAIPKLLENGHAVLGCDISPKRSPLDYEFQERDLRNEQDAMAAAMGVDVVIQAAASVFGTLGFHSRGADILSSDMRVHLNLLDAARDRGVQHFVYVSSSVVYEGVNQLPLTEESIAAAPPPTTGYGLSKFFGERACRVYQEACGLTYTIWRPFNIITPYEKAGQQQGISHVFADFIQNIIVERQNPAPIIGSGFQTRCFTWAEDVSSVIARSVEDPTTTNQTFNVGSSEQVSMLDLATRIHRKGVQRGILDDGVLEFTHVAAAPADIQHRMPDCTKAERMLGWKATMNLDQMLDKCIDHAASGM